MKIYENKPNQGISPYQRLKMNKHTPFHNPQKPFCPKLKPKYSFEESKLLVQISQTFVRVLSEKISLGQNSDVFRTK